MDIQMFLHHNTLWILVILCLGVSLSSQKINFEETFKYGKMSPDDPLVEEGTDLVVNCTILSSYTGDSTAADIYFTFNGVNYTVDSLHVTEMTSQTAEFRLPNMTRSLTEESIFCYIPDISHWIGHQKIQVASLPEMPRLTECRVYDWKNMTCSWQPEKQDTGLPTDQQLYWTIFPPDLHVCPHPSKKSATCSWKGLDDRDSLKPGMDYSIRIAANSSLRTVYSQDYYIETKFRVEPRKVDWLNRVNSTSTTLMLSWSGHDDSRTLLYEVSWIAYDKQNHTWREPLARNTSVRNMTLDGLSPATRYWIQLRAIPLFGDRGYNCEEHFSECHARGFWSKAKEEIFNTEEDVPAAAPRTTPGGFMWHGDMGVVLFWQPVPDYLSNGNITHYYVNHTLLETQDDTRHVRPVSGSRHQVDIKLQPGHIYKFIVDARTKQGFNTSLQHQPIVISTAKAHMSEKKTPEIFSSIAKEELGVVVNWTQVEEATGYTVFWCKGKVMSPNCDEELHWVELENDQTNVTVLQELVLQERFAYKFGFAIRFETTMPAKSTSKRRLRRSADTLSLSSGLQWGDCIHADIGAEMPLNFALSDLPKAETLGVEWEKPQCHKTGFILYYNIFYCQVKYCEEPKRIEVHNKKTSYVINDLKADTEYKVWMTSMSASGSESAPTADVSKTVERAGLHPKYIALIVVAGLIVVLLAGVGAHYFCWKTKKRVTKYDKTEVTLPAGIIPTDYQDGDTEDLVERVTTSGGSLMQQNRDNEALYQERKAVEAGRPILYAVDDEGNSLCANGGVGTNAGRVRFEKKLSSHGSVSSQETLTTPLPSLDTPRDDAEFFRVGQRNRNISGGSNLDTVPEVPKENRNKGDRSYYNVSDSSSIGSYNKVGCLEDDPRVTGRAPHSGSETGSPPPVGGARGPSLSSPETSPLRSPTHPAFGRSSAQKASSPVGGGQTSPTVTGASPYDIPSEISSYSKIDCRDLSPSEYDSSAGSHISTDTVIDTYRSRAPVSPLTAAPTPLPSTAAPAPPPQTGDYVDQGFMQTMASNASLSGSDTSDIAPYSVVGQRSDTSDSNNSKDAYLDYNENEDADSNESEPLVLTFDWSQKKPTNDPEGAPLTGLPPATSTSATCPTQSTALGSHEQPLTNGLDDSHSSFSSDNDESERKGEDQGETRDTHFVPRTTNGPIATKNPSEGGSTSVRKDKNSNSSAFPNAKHSSSSETPLNKSPITNGHLSPPIEGGGVSNNAFTSGGDGVKVKPRTLTDGGYVTLDSLTSSSGISVSSTEGDEGDALSDEGDVSSGNTGPVSAPNNDNSGGYVAHADILNPGWNKVSV